MPRTKPKAGRKLPGGGYYTLVGLKAVREAKGVSRTQLARDGGMSRNTIWYLEEDARVARWQTVSKLANALGVEPLMLLYEPEDGGDESAA